MNFEQIARTIKFNPETKKVTAALMELGTRLQDGRTDITRALSCLVHRLGSVSRPDTAYVETNDKAATRAATSISILSLENWCLGVFKEGRYDSKKYVPAIAVSIVKDWAIYKKWFDFTFALVDDTHVAGTEELFDGRYRRAVWQILVTFVHHSWKPEFDANVPVDGRPLYQSLLNYVVKYWVTSIRITDFEDSPGKVPFTTVPESDLHALAMAQTMLDRCLITYALPMYQDDFDPMTDVVNFGADALQIRMWTLEQLNENRKSPPLPLVHYNMALVRSGLVTKEQDGDEANRDTVFLLNIVGNTSIIFSRITLFHPRFTEPPDRHKDLYVVSVRNILEVVSVCTDNSNNETQIAACLAQALQGKLLTSIFGLIAYYQKATTEEHQIQLSIPEITNHISMILDRIADHLERGSSIIYREVKKFMRAYERRRIAGSDPIDAETDGPETSIRPQMRDMLLRRTKFIRDAAKALRCRDEFLRIYKGPLCGHVGCHVPNTGQLKRCADCHAMFYCSRECQKLGREDHREGCKVATDWRRVTGLPRRSNHIDELYKRYVADLRAELAKETNTETATTAPVDPKHSTESETLG